MRAVSNASVTCVRPLGLDLLPDEVAVEERRRARRPRVRDGDEAAVGRRHPEHDVGEGEVGEQLPVADEQVQPLDVGLAGAPLREDEITERRHASSVAGCLSVRTPGPMPRDGAAARAARPARALRRASGGGTTLLVDEALDGQPRRRRGARPRAACRRPARRRRRRGGRRARCAPARCRRTGAASPHLPRRSDARGAGPHPVHHDAHAAGLDGLGEVDVAAEEARQADRIGRADGDDVVGRPQRCDGGRVAPRREQVARDLLVGLEAEAGVDDDEVDPVACRRRARPSPGCLRAPASARHGRCR